MSRRGGLSARHRTRLHCGGAAAEGRADQRLELTAHQEYREKQLHGPTIRDRPISGKGGLVNSIRQLAGVNAWMATPAFHRLVLAVLRFAEIRAGRQPPHDRALVVRQRVQLRRELVDALLKLLHLS